MMRFTLRVLIVLGLVFGLFLTQPAQAQTQTENLTLVPRTNAIQSGQITSAPVGAVFTLAVLDQGLSGGLESVAYTAVTGDTNTSVASNLVNAINADSQLHALGIAAKLNAGSAYSITSSSPNPTLYTETSTNGGINTITTQETLSFSGTAKVGDVLTVTVHDAGLVNGAESVSYTVATGNSLLTVVNGIRAALNADSKLSSLGITAGVGPSIFSLSIQSPSFDRSAHITSYTTSTNAGATETMTLGDYFGTNGPQIVQVTGSITPGDVLGFLVLDQGLTNGLEPITHAVQSNDTLATISCAFASAVNADSNLSAIGVTAACGGSGSFTVAFTSVDAPQVVVINPNNQMCFAVNGATQWPYSQVKQCNSSTDTAAEIATNTTNAQYMLSTVEALINQNAFPGGLYAPNAAAKLNDQGYGGWYMYVNHADYFSSGSWPLFPPTGGPPVGCIVVTFLFAPINNAYVFGYSVPCFILGTNGSYSAIFGDDANNPSSKQPSSNPDPWIQHATAHETGHQLDVIYGPGIFNGVTYSSQAAFQNALAIDIAAMQAIPACQFPITAPSGEGGNVQGFWSSANDKNGNPICNDPPHPTQAPAPGSSQYGSTAWNVLVSNAFSPFFKNAFNGKQNPGSEVFAELYAVMVGFPDTVATNGNPYPGSDSGMQVGAYATTGSFTCAAAYVNALITTGSPPYPAALALIGYTVPGNSNPQYNGTIHYCDGSTAGTVIFGGT